MKLFTLLLMCFILVAGFNTHAQDVTDTYLTNPSFETGDLSGWTLTGADGYGWNTTGNDGDGSQDGAYNAGVWNRPIGDVEWAQIITDLPNGFYKVSCLMSVTDVTSWTDGVSKRITTQRLYANDKSVLYGYESDYSAENLAILSGLEEYSFFHLETASAENGPFYPISTIVEVTDGNLVIGARTNGDASAYAFDFQGENTDRGFFKIDGFTLTDVSDLLIESISIGGETITDIDFTDVLLLSMDLPTETTEVPEIIATVGEGVTVDIIPALPGKTEIVLTSADGSYSTSYFVEFTKVSDATLKNISANTGELSPEFNRTTTEYDYYVDYGITSINLDITPTVPDASVTVYDLNTGEALNIDQAITWVAEDQGIDLEIVVTSFDESTEITYVVYVMYNDLASTATISNIESTTGSLTAEVDPVVTEYELVVPIGTESVDITGVPTAETATVVGDGTVTLADGVGSITISITSPDETNSIDYTINVREAYVLTDQDYFIQHKLQGYVLGELDGYLKLQEPELNKATQYFRFVDSGVGGEYYLQNKNDRYLTSTFDPVWDMVFADVLSADLDSCRWRLEPEETGGYRIVTVARENNDYRYVAPHTLGLGNGVFNDKPYSWEDVGNIWEIKDIFDLVDPYDTSLDTITVDAGVSISPDVAKGVTDYYVVLPVAGLSTLNIDATAVDETATVTGDGAIDVSGGNGSFEITVTATDPEYSTTVTIHYMEDTELTLKHSYTFSDGTAKDVQGGADGTVIGGSITDGIYTGAEVGDYIELPAEQIAINTYPSLTIEIYMADDEATTNANANTMVSYFGRTNDSNYGEDYMYTSMKCSSVLSVSDGGSPWSFEQGVNTGIDLHDDGNPHHLVTTISNDSLVFYVDGYVMDTAYFSGNNCIANLSNELAYLMKGGYTGDNTWLGSVLEYNIYSGVMSPQEIALGALDWPNEGSDADATLSDLTLDGVTIEGFNGAVLDYTIQVETLPTEVIPTTKAEGASAEITATATTIPGQTTILVTAVGGNTNTYTINYELATAIGEVKDLGIKVYPTVSNGSFTVESEGASTVVTVYSLTGRVIDQFMTNSSTETFELDQEGMYIIKVNSDGITKLFKVIKK